MLTHRGSLSSSSLRDDVASIAQREVGTDTVSFAEALRNAMRQDPDVIMVGEMRDLGDGLDGAHGSGNGASGLLYTAHQQCNAQTIDRILDTFSGERPEAGSGCSSSKCSKGVDLDATGRDARMVSRSGGGSWRSCELRLESAS